MSKRNSISGGTPTSKNTLFNYFAKSPASVPAKKLNTGSPSPAPAPKKHDTKVALKEGSPELIPTKRPLEPPSDNEDDVILSKKKRRRILKVDSDSDEENTNPAANQPDEAETTETANSSFMQKLQKLDSQVDETPDVSKVSDDGPAPTIDEPVVWPHNKLEFLKPENIKDKKGRRPNHPDYDASTLYVPDKFLNTLSPGVRQWWVLKMDNFDCVLFFKVGKFYELYHMDADVGVKELGFTYMRGEFAHSGFPEVSYDKMASILIDRGYKVARVEQTETPDMMTIRCKNQSKPTKFDKVVRREICQITNKGTRVFGSQCQVTPNYQPNYMLAIVEKNKGSSSSYGICFIDTSIGDFFIGQFDDDNNSSRLLTLLAHYYPVLVLYERHGVSIRTQDIFRTVLSATLKEALTKDSQMWNAAKTLKYLAENYYSKDENTKWPDSLKIMQDEGDHLGLTPVEEFELGLQALGGCISYLTKCHLNEKVLDMARYNIYLPPDMVADEKALNKLIDSAKKKATDLQLRPTHMVLDAITLANLRITGEDHSLQSTLDSCCTKFGKRLLHRWICAPSCDIHVIKQRQDAISELLQNGRELQEMRALLSTLPDFERYLAQIHLYGNKSVSKNHPDGRAIFFEEKTYNKKKIQNFISILKGFESLVDIPQFFAAFESDLIRQLTQYQPTGTYPNFKEALDFFKNSFNHEEALKDGAIAPEKGVDKEFDSIEAEIDDLNIELNKYLIAQEKYFGCRLNYFGTDKKRFQLEVPEREAKKAGKDYFLEGQRKGAKPVRRFHTNETKEFLRRMMQAEEQRNQVLKDLSRRIFEKFSDHYDLWKHCIDSIATLDVLGSLAEYAKSQSIMCVPQLEDNADVAFIEMEDGYHPCMSSDTYIPNGITIGGSSTAALALLTGPNMGGKSTLMRQIGLLTVMAQIGSHIPAQSCKMSIVDRIFTRLGAQDDIIAGHSTFLVELNETSAILKHATKNSLVLLDELGRGTATYDGTAIAASVVNFLADLRCRTLFSTHYHSLVEYFHNDPRIYLGHMACMVENEVNEDPTQETVTFLYKYTTGACPKSYGFNAAKLAGMPHPMINRAYELSKKVEAIALKRKILSKIIAGESASKLKNLLLSLRECHISIKA